MKRLSSLGLGVVTVGALAFALNACESDSGNGPQASADAAGTQDTAGGQDVPAAACDATPDLTGTVFLVDSLVLAEPADQALLDALNPLFAKDIVQGDLIMLFHVTAWDETTSKAQVDVGNGLLQDGNYVWDGAPNQLELNVDKCAFTMSTQSSLALKPATVNKPIIVSGLLVDGAFAADGSALPSANLAGAIKRSDAEGLEVTLAEGLDPVPLDVLFDSFSLVEDADTDNDGTPDGWTLTGTLSGVAVTNVSLD